PMQWNDEDQAGFTKGTPWLKVNPNYPTINVKKAMQDEESVYHHYKKLIQLRKSNETLIYGKYDLIVAEHDEVYAYTRTWNDEIFIIISNLFAKETSFTFPEEFQQLKSESVLHNVELDKELFSLTHLMLQPYESHVFKVINE